MSSSHQGHFKGNDSNDSRMFPSLIDGSNSKRMDRLTQSLVIEGNNNGEASSSFPESRQLNKLNTEHITNNVTNVVQVDFIDAEYDARNEKGFDKRYNGYDGGKGGPRNNGQGDNGTWGGYPEFDRQNKPITEEDTYDDTIDQQNPRIELDNGNNGATPRRGPLSDAQVRKMMDEDPHASKFLRGMMSGSDDGEVV